MVTVDSLPNGNECPTLSERMCFELGFKACEKNMNWQAALEYFISHFSEGGKK